MECAVCFHSFTISGAQEPIVLECGHTFCSTCVGHFSKNFNNECATCRRNFRTTKTNFQLVELLKENADSKSSSNEQLPQRSTSQIEKKFLMNAYYVIGLIFIAVIMLFTGFGANLVCHGVGFIHPFYFTIKSIETKKHETRWLIYWIVYGFLGILEPFIFYLLSWIPFFYPLKVFHIINI